MTHKHSVSVFISLFLLAIVTKAQAPLREKPTLIQGKLDQPSPQRFVGHYRLSPTSAALISSEGNHLYMKLPGQLSFEIVPHGGLDFVSSAPPVSVVFRLNDEKVVVGFQLHEPGEDISASRIVVKTATDLRARTEAIGQMGSIEFAKRPTGSITIGVVSGKQLIWTKSLGNADMESKTLADAATIYRIGSVTKMFTTLMFDQLVDAGKVHFTDPVETFFPEIRLVQGRFASAPPVTFFQLATHTSGLGKEPDNLDIYIKDPIDTWEATLVSALPHVHFEAEPGTQYIYSNVGFAILGAALSRVAKEPYADYVAQRIFAPIGMEHTYLKIPTAELSHLSKGYDLNDGKVHTEGPQRDHAGRGYKVPNGAAYTTVGDLAKFASFLMGFGSDSVLRSSSLEHFLTDTVVSSDITLGDGYGLGGTIIRRGDYTAFGHDGDVPGYEAALYMNRAAGIGVIVLANSTGDAAPDVDTLALNSLDLLSRD